MLVCDKCQASINEDSKFCPQCGDPVTDDDIVATALDQSVPTAEIKFGRSSSVSYDKAISMCKNIPSFYTEGEGKNLMHTVSLPLSELDFITNLYDIVGSWKSSKMLINGKLRTKKDLVYHGLGCYREYRTNPHKNSYCFGTQDYDKNIWGCKKLEMPIYEWGGGWLEFGKFDKNAVWSFDKKRIKQHLEESITKVDLCPAFDRQKVFGALDLIPDQIDPDTNPNWDYDKRMQEIKGQYREIAVGVKPIIKKINHYVFGSHKPHWKNDNVSPPEVKIKVEIKESQKKSNPILRKILLSKYTWYGIIIFLIYILSSGKQ